MGKIIVVSENEPMLDRIEQIRHNWNMGYKERGDELFYLAKGLKDESVIHLCISLAKDEYERARLMGNRQGLCNLAHCYYVLGSISYKKRQMKEANEYYLKSIETHIEGSRNKNYQFEDFYRFNRVNKEENIDSILSTIMLSSPQDFNDPIDCPIVQEKSPDFFFPNKTIFDGIKVCCFGQTYRKHNNEVPFYADAKKWAYYGDKHKGICIRYHFFPNELEKVLSTHFVFNPVNYKSQFSFKRGIVADGLLSKSDQYKEEKEWRLIWFDRKYKSNKYYDVKNNCLFAPIEIDNITSIYVGYRCPDNIVAKVIEFAKQKKGSPLLVYRIQPDPNNLFRMTKTELYPNYRDR